MRYVALGDSLTIGNAVAAAERWPHQLVAALAGEASLAGRRPPLELVGNLATSDSSTLGRHRSAATAAPEPASADG